MRLRLSLRRPRQIRFAQATPFAQIIAAEGLVMRFPSRSTTYTMLRDGTCRSISILRQTRSA